MGITDSDARVATASMRVAISSMQRGQVPIQFAAGSRLERCVIGSCVRGDGGLGLFPCPFASHAQVTGKIITSLYISSYSLDIQRHGGLSSSITKTALCSLRLVPVGALTGVTRR